MAFLQLSKADKIKKRQIQTPFKIITYALLFINSFLLLGPCIPFKIDLSSQETNSTKYTTNLSITSISIKNHKKIQKSLNEISESNEKDSKTIPETQFGDEKIDCLDQNKKIITDNSYQIEQGLIFFF